MNMFFMKKKIWQPQVGKLDKNSEALTFNVGITSSQQHGPNTSQQPDHSSHHHGQKRRRRKSPRCLWEKKIRNGNKKWPSDSRILEYAFDCVTCFSVSFLLVYIAIHSFIPQYTVLFCISLATFGVFQIWR